MKRIYYTILLCMACFTCHAQLCDMNWTIGDHPVTLLNFSSDSVKLDSINSPWGNYFITNACISDEYGNYLYSTNGVYIFDRHGDTLLNGTGINPCSYTENYTCCGLNINQAALFIPQPGNNRYYYLFHFSNDDANSDRPATIYYSLIDKQGNNGLGAVIEKNVPVLHATILRGGGMTACKHANGRDYWLIMGASKVDTFYKFLITPNGIEGPFAQGIGPSFPGAFDNAYSRFSQDGSKFVTGVYEGPILVMDFDRCSGEFSNPISIYNESCPNAPSCSGSASVEFSPDNRFVYVSDVIWLTQYDLLAANIQDSVQISLDSTQYGRLNMLQLAPDGKIYLSTWDGVLGTDSMHVINNPNGKGDTCNFKYAYQPTYTGYAVDMPNLINYRLGVLAGSGCDTITAVNNVPLINDNIARIYPNPAHQTINLTYTYNTSPVEFDLIDNIGQAVIKQILGNSQNFAQFSTATLSNGLYYWQLKDSEHTIKTGKVAVVK